MGDSLREQAHKAALAQVRAEKPASFTVGGHYDGKKIVGGLTYDRSWKNGLGLTAYLKAYWNDLPVTTHTPKAKPQVSAGVEATYRF